MTRPPLTTPFRIGDVTVSNRVLLAPLAGIGNWFVRLQARRHGAGLAVSEMVSSFGLHHRNERTIGELLRIHPAEHPVSIQLFGHDPDVMRSAAAIAADAGADLIDINMGCPVRKIRAAGAGAALLQPARARLATRSGRGPGLGTAGHRKAQVRACARRSVRVRPGRAAGGGGGRRRGRHAPSKRSRPAQGMPRLRARRRAGRGDWRRRPCR